MKSFAIPDKTACLITDKLNRKYLTDIDIAEGFLVLGKTSAYFTDARYFSAAKEKIESAGLTAKLYKNLDSVFEFIKDLGAEKLLVDFSTTTVREFNTYKEYGLPVEDLSERLENTKAIKTTKEISIIKKACEIAEKAYHNGMKCLCEGMTEQQLKNIIEDEIIKLGGEGASFDIIVAFGANAAVPHHETGDTSLKDDSVILIDMGAIVDGYISDVTRTAFFGTPSEKFLDCYDAVLNANLLAEENVTAGMKCIDADAIARNYLKERGYGEYFTHSLGHGVGMQVHEFPYLSPKSNATLENGMTFTIEPGVYFDGEFGIRIEDTVMLENGKLVRLFSDDKSLNIIKK